jgi:HrpA-like RNA helicase
VSDVAFAAVARTPTQGPGACYRLYTQKTYDGMAASPLPEIQRTDLTQTVLQLKEMGVADVQKFDFLDKPDPDFSTSPSSSPRNLLG